MAAFSAKKLNTPPRFCTRLKQERLRRGISIETLAKTTRVNKAYLKAIEECRIDDIPVATVYIKQYIRRYAHTVGLDEIALLHAFGFETGWRKKPHSQEAKAHPTPMLTTRSFLNMPKLTRAIVLLGITGLFTAGVVWQLLHFLKPPTLLVINPPDGFITMSPDVIIEGYTEKEVAIHINGTPVQNNEDGFFQTQIPLQTGANTIAIQATKRSGKQTTNTRTVVREDGETKISLK